MTTEDNTTPAEPTETTEPQEVKEIALPLAVAAALRSHALRSNEPESTKEGDAK